MLTRRAKILSAAVLTGTLIVFAQFAIAGQHSCGTVPMEHATCASQCIVQDDTTMPGFGAALPSSVARASFPPVSTEPSSCAECDAPATGRTLQVLYCSYQN